MAVSGPISDPTTTRAGFIGVGQMGMPMLEQLCGAGIDVTFRARRPEVIAAAEALGARSVDDFSDRDVVIVCVFDDDQLREVAASALETMRAGAVLVNHTTSHPATSERLEEEAGARGVAFLDATVSGGPDEIRRGELTVLVGGDPATLDAARPALAAYSDPIIHVGRVGDGQRVKLINNALFGAQTALLVDAERVATELGMDPQLAFRAITRCSGASRALELVVASGSAAALQEAAGRYIRKDVALVEDVARSAGIDLGRLGSS